MNYQRKKKDCTKKANRVQWEYVKNLRRGVDRSYESERVFKVSF